MIKDDVQAKSTTPSAAAVPCTMPLDHATIQLQNPQATMTKETQ